MILSLLSLLVNPITLFLAMWCGTALLFSLRLVPYPTLSGQTIIVILLSIIAFMLGSLSIMLVTATKHSGVLRKSGRELRWLNFSRLRLILLILIPLRISYILVRANAILESTDSRWTRIFTDGGVLRHEFRRVGLGEGGIERLDLSSALVINSLSIVSAAVFLVGGVYLAVQRRNSILPYLVILISLLQSVLLLSRAGMVQDLIMFAVGYVYVTQYLRRHKSIQANLNVKKSRMLLPFAILVFVVMMMFLINNILVSKSSTWTDYEIGVPPLVLSIYWYLTGPYTALDFFLSGEVVHTLGGYTFRIFAKWLAMAGLIDQGSVSPAIGEFIRLEFSPSRQNTYTWLRSFYVDFGLVGVIILPFAFGVLAALFLRLAQRRPTLTNLMVLSLLLSTIFFSIMDFTFKDIELIGMIVIAWLLQRWLSSRRRFTIVYGRRRLF